MQEIWTEYSLSAGALELRLLPGLGGRLWDIRHDGQSLLFQNPDLIGKALHLSDLGELPTRSPQFAFPLWGGEKTWIAPDRDWRNGAPYPQLDSGVYDIQNVQAHSVEMHSDICPICGLQVLRRIEITGSQSWCLKHQVTNQGTTSRFAGIWSVMMLQRPSCIGSVVSPGSTPETIFGDVGSALSNCGSLAVVNCTLGQEFKLGVTAQTGRSFIRCSTGEVPLWLSCTTAVPRPGLQYARGHNFEIFNSADYPYCEAEWHGPAQLLEPGESMSFAQEFRLQSQDEIFSDGSITLEEVEVLSCMCL